MKFTSVLFLLGASPAVLATPAPENGVTPNTVAALGKRATFPIPASKGSVTYTKPETIKAGKVFDGGLKTYGRGVKCTGQAEGGESDAVFLLEEGATLKNAIIGADQIEGVHCKGSCTIQNVWWKAVCEDALSIKGDGNASVKGGGATGADDKVIQHNGLGTVTIDGFTAVDFGKLYRSCGNCKKMGQRNVVVKNVKAYNGKTLVGINSNKGDIATIDSKTCASSVKEICVEYEGTTPGNEPKKLRSGPSSNCKYSSLKAC
ncbi:polysaccharide lyase family 3 protein [Durotheca rogersii]|uniref:polysaccharide lyase family 3 protein n=1 Tax=Durotheca rogersii TaxID=419775 RepID=UPI002220B9AF|nr:polysaccharide lyase family 3 protein [Durotheca rogersii]KAI5863671.1 polysaccharide lyase family 3 protein [Durotheca rogersii]